MMELTASQPVLINRGMLYLDWNLGDPTPWGHHLARTSRPPALDSTSLDWPATVYLYTVRTSSTRATFVTDAFSYTRPADAAFISPLRCTDWCPSVPRYTVIDDLVLTLVPIRRESDVENFHEQVLKELGALGQLVGVFVEEFVENTGWLK